MAALASRSGASSAVGSISDLDGYTLPEYTFPASSQYASLHDDDFGFDPPQHKSLISAHQLAYSPPSDLSLSGWPEFEREGDPKPTTEAALNLDGYDMDKFISSALPDTHTAVSRFGQMTPPRSNSAVSSDSHSKDDAALSPKTAAPGKRRRGKPAVAKANAKAAPSASATTPRKRKPTKKASAAAAKTDSPEEQKRRQSLEKNRLAAAKCRVNKKEKTEQLQQDSHDKAVQNAYLKNQIIRMKDEIQQINALLLAHANCDGCKSPDEIQAHLSALGNEFFTKHLAMPAHAHAYAAYPPLQFPDMPVMPPQYFAAPNPDHLLNPPLPEFDRSADFEVHTPMKTD